MDEDDFSPMSYDDWRDSFQTLNRGRQRWETRVKFYHRILEMTSPELPELKWVCKTLRTSTFYDHFEAKATAPVRYTSKDSDPREALVMETKSWSFDPYRQGLLAEFEVLEPQPDIRVDCIVMALARWAADEPIVAAACGASPPLSALHTLHGALQTLSDYDWAQVESIGRHVILRTISNPDETPLAILNTVRPSIRQMKDAPDPVVGNTAAAELVEHLAGVITHALGHTSDQPAIEHENDRVPTMLLARAIRTLEAASR